LADGKPLDRPAKATKLARTLRARTDELFDYYVHCARQTPGTIHVVASHPVSEQMSRFVARHFGARGRAWLAQLPGLIESCAAEWDLLIEDGLDGGLLSCVMSARTTGGQPVVLKIGGPWTPISREACALEHWAGGPAPSLLQADQRLGALLLERISPGSAAGEDPEEVAGLLRALHAARPSAPQTALLPSLAELVEERVATAGEEAFARSPAEAKALAPALRRARAEARELLDGFSDDVVLLHGDLEPRNILRCASRGVIAIDPIPCIGDASYDAAYWAAEGTADGVEDRINTLAKCASLDLERIRRWSAVIALGR
jgi:streptomycin 6-kinase